MPESQRWRRVGEPWRASAAGGHGTPCTGRTSGDPMQRGVHDCRRGRRTLWPINAWNTRQPMSAAEVAVTHERNRALMHGRETAGSHAWRLARHQP
jgi:hypothetical protein